MRVHVGLFMELAGVFWKSSLVFEDDILIIEVLWVLQKASVMMLLPHMKEWLYCHAEPWEGRPGIDDYTTINMKYPEGERDDFAVLARDGAGCVSLEHDKFGDLSAYTIGGLYRGANYYDAPDDPGQARVRTESSPVFQIFHNRVQLAAYPILRRLDTDEPYSWWIVTLGRQFRGRVFAVNFEYQLFWNQAMGNNVVCCWTDGDGLWDPVEWALMEAAKKDGGWSKPLSEIVDDTLDSQRANDGKESDEEKGTEFDTVSDHFGSDIGDDEGSDDEGSDDEGSDNEGSDHDVEDDYNESGGDEGYWDYSHWMIRNLASYRLK